MAYARAAEVYELVLEHDREHGGKTGSQAGIEPRLRAYCQHYLHYNRAKMAEPSREPIRATEAGYREALVDWPGHAVFWSRLVLCLFIQKRRNEAWAALLEAEASVQEHRDKQRKLYARTVTRLLQRSMVSEALWVWGDRTAITLAKGLLAQSSLERALAEGWRDDRMWLPERRDVAFTEDMPHRLTAVESGWAATLQDLQLTSRGETRIAAFCRLAHNVRETVSTALTTLTTQLSAAGRLRKGILLARVDLHLSGLAVEAGEFAWLVGSVVRSEENQRVFKPLDGAGTLLDLAPELQDRVTVAPELILAKVRRSLPGGPASGPVVGVEELPAMPEEEVEPFLRSILNG
ncbi:MAG: hypothetical protein JKY65_27910 [Planctomycetes bacterium]|nr:hypothetical protein [Planctomycetota bacterium]